jgi:hypothetical protein
VIFQEVVGYRMMVANRKMKECDTEVSRQKAVRIIRKYLCRQILKDLELQDGIPDGCILYGISKDEPCWTASITPDTMRVGAGRMICISKREGKVIFDGIVGE